jgi:chromosome segregation ATPase
MSINFFEKIAKNNNKYAYKNLFNDKEISEDEFNKFKNDNIDDNKKIKDDKELNDNKIINNKQKANEPEIRNEIKENKNTEILKELTEEKNKNKKLENELKEKNKKIENLEKEVKQLKNELEKQIKINKDCEDKIALSKITFDSKDETYKALLEKDKEIKALKEKMKRFPFELNENEKLISIIFTNSTQEFHYSIICKNTEIFTVLEAKLYEKFPQYGETANYFIANGNKVIGHKTLEDNNIKDSNIIILYQFEV